MWLHLSGYTGRASMGTWAKANVGSDRGNTTKTSCNQSPLILRCVPRSAGVPLLNPLPARVCGSSLPTRVHPRQATAAPAGGR